MQEYIECEVRLGWLIDPDAKEVEVYTADGQVELLENPQTLEGGEILPGLVVDLAEILD